MMAKPMKTIEMHYPMMQFLIKAINLISLCLHHDVFVSPVSNPLCLATITSLY